jgi:hypothetical protein
MKIDINGIEVSLNFEIEIFSEIVRYMKFYEPQRKMSLTKYLNLLDDDDYIIDIICDLIYYPYAMSQKNKGLIVELNYDQVFGWLIKNTDKIKEFSTMLAESMPQPEEGKEVKKKTIRKSTK